jgi:hypothetical protein
MIQQSSSPWMFFVPSLYAIGCFMACFPLQSIHFTHLIVTFKTRCVVDSHIRRDSLGMFNHVMMWLLHSLLFSMWLIDAHTRIVSIHYVTSLIISIIINHVETIVATRKTSKIEILDRFVLGSLHPVYQFVFCLHLGLIYIIVRRRHRLSKT